MRRVAAAGLKDLLDSLYGYCDSRVCFPTAGRYRGNYVSFLRTERALHLDALNIRDGMEDIERGFCSRVVVLKSSGADPSALAQAEFCSFWTDAVLGPQDGTS